MPITLQVSTASRVLGALFLALLLIAPVAAADVFPENVQGEVIKIGMTISLTGKYATEGTQALCGVKAVINWYNKQGGVEIGGIQYQLQLVYYDDQSSKDNVQALYGKLINDDQVDFLLAPYSSGLTLSALPVAEQNNKLILSHGGASDSIVSQGYYYIVQVLTPASRYLASAADLVNEKIPDAKVALIFENAAFAQAVKQGLKQKLEEYGINVVYEADYEAGTTDFASFIQQAKQAGADVLLGGGHFEDGKALVSQAHQYQWSLKFIAILVAPAQPAFYTELGEEVANGVAYPSQWSPRANYSPEAAAQLGIQWAGPTIDEYLQEFQAVCPNLEAPAYQSAEAGAAIVYLVEAIKKAYEMYGPDAIRDSAKVREAFNDLEIMTFFGPLKIDPATGKQIAHPMLLMQWQGDQRVIIYPDPYAEAQPLIAPPNWQFQEAAAGGETTTSPTGGEQATTPAGGGAATTAETTQEEGGGAGAAAAVAVIIILLVAAAAFYFMKKG